MNIKHYQLRESLLVKRTKACSKSKLSILVCFFYFTVHIQYILYWCCTWFCIDAFTPILLGIHLSKAELSSHRIWYIWGEKEVVNFVFCDFLWQKDHYWCDFSIVKLSWFEIGRVWSSELAVTATTEHNSSNFPHSPEKQFVICSVTREIITLQKLSVTVG